MPQSRLESLREALANVAIGFLVGLAAQQVIFPAWGLEVPSFRIHLGIAASFTFLSVARSYAVRRFFARPAPPPQEEPWELLARRLDETWERSEG